MSDFKLVSIVDSVLEDITSEVTLPVITGTTANNFQNQTSQAPTGTSQMQFEIQVPSTETVTSRNLLIQTGIDLQVDFTGGTTAGYWEPNQTLFAYGKCNSLQAFPLNTLITTAQAQINGAAVNVVTRDVMPALLKMYNYEELAKYNSLTPSLIDSFYQDFQDGLGSNNNVLSNYSVGGFTKEYQPRGVFPVKLYQSDGQTPINGLSIKADANGTSPYASIIVRFLTTEPLLFLSPFISGNCKNKAGFLGISKMNITLFFGDATRSMSNASYALQKNATTTVPTISNVSFKTYRDPIVLLHFLTVPPTLADKLAPQNILNYTQYMSYPLSTSSSIPSKSYKTLAFNNVQLSQIPSKILIFVKKSQQTTYDSNSFMSITGTSITFANKSSALAGASQVQLYDMSVRNGLQMNYYEFSGSGISNDEDGNPVEVPTIGSVLCIDPAMDLSIDTQYSNMCNGQYGLSFTLNVYNQSKDAITPTVYLVVANSGMFVTKDNICETRTGFITQDMVLKTKMQETIMDKQTYEQDIVGGSIENLNSLHKHMKLNFHKATEKEHMLDHAPGEVVQRTEAAGMSASGMNLPGQRRIRKYT